MADEALVRWEQMRREHLSGAIALLFGLSSASLAFCGSLLTQDSVHLGGERTTYFLRAVFFFVGTVVVSVLVMLTRLQDVRVTASIVQLRDDCDAKEDVACLRCSARFWGSMTWWLFRLQLLTFSLGACFLLIALRHIFHSKFYPALPN